MARRRARVRIVIGAAALAALAASACVPKPVVGTGVALRQGANHARVWDNADPAVLVDGSRTFLYGTSNNVWLPVREVTSFDASIEESRFAWDTNPVDAMATRPAWVDPDERAIWAPSVIRTAGGYLAYFASARESASVPTVDEGNDQCIGRAFATNPMGPFAPEPLPIYCGLPRGPGSNHWGKGALDPEVFRAPDGRLTLLVALSRTRDHIGVLRLDGTGRPVGGTNAVPTTLASQGLPFHDGTDDGRLSGFAFLENPSMIYEPASRSYLLFYSAGTWHTSSYLTGFARCASPVGPCAVDRRGPFLVAGGDRSATGGLTAFRSASGTPMVAYHSWFAGAEAYKDPTGFYARRTHWAHLFVDGTAPSTQRVSLGRLPPGAPPPKR